MLDLQQLALTQLIERDSLLVSDTRSEGLPVLFCIPPGTCLLSHYNNHKPCPAPAFGPHRGGCPTDFGQSSSSGGHVWLGYHGGSASGYVAVSCHTHVCVVVFVCTHVIV